MASPTGKKIVLHIGDPIKYNTELYNQLFSGFEVIRPPLAERHRAAFRQALKEKRWGNFHALFRPQMFSGSEMYPWDEELISLLPPSVKIFASAGAGYENVDVRALARKGVVYCNSAGSGSEAVADMAIFHILACFRNISWTTQAARSGRTEEWMEAFRYVPDTAHNLEGHTLGIIGMGSIGFRIARKAFLAFGMKIVYYDVVRKPRRQEKEVQATFYENLDDVLAIADCVVLAVPFEGKKLITTEKLKKFKKGSRLVNIARGGLVDEEALADALESRHIFAAGLDVYENEPHINPRLVALGRYTSLTCHNAGDAIETHVDFERLCIENVARVLGGLEALTPVRPILAHL